MPSRIAEENIFTILSAKERLQNRSFSIGSDDSKESCQKKCLGQSQSQKKEKVLSANIVGDIMWPVVLFLKFSGHCPLTYAPIEEAAPSDDKREVEKSVDVDQNRKESGRNGPWLGRQYQIKFKSFLFLWSAIGALWILIDMANFIYGTIFSPNLASLGGLEIRATNSTKTVVTTAKAIRLGVLVMQSLEVILAWLESISLARILNACGPVQQEFQATFPYLVMLGLRYRRLKRLRNFLIIIYVALPTLWFIVIYFYAYGFNIFKFSVTFPFAWHLSALTLMEDVKVIMIYRTLAESFGQIRDGISHSLKWETITLEKVSCWRRMVHAVRCQVDHVGKSQTGHQLMLISGSMGLITGLIFILLIGPTNGVQNRLVYIFGCGILVYFTGRVYIKILAASSITKEEGLLAHELICMDTSNMDLSTQMEIKFIHDIITHNPSVICFGGYINLDKRLILGIASQVVTYLIVLMQFTRP